MDERALLERLGEGPASGDALARDAGLTRAAIWKRIDALRAAGVEVEAAPGRGYALRWPVSLLDADAIRRALPAAARAGLADDPEAVAVAWSLDSTSSALPSSMKSMLPEYPVAMTGFPNAMASAIVSPKPSARCSET